PNHPCDGVVELDLARRVGTVAELVLEPLDVEGVAAAVRQHSREQEARQAGGRLREYQKRVAHRCRAEPLVTVQLILAVLPGPGARRVGPNVRAALLLGHRHAQQDATLARVRPGPWGVM